MQRDDIALIMDDAIPRCQWKLGRVVDTYPDSDGLVRKVSIVSIQLGDLALSSKGIPVSKPKFLERPVHKLVMLVEADLLPYRRYRIKPKVLNLMFSFHYLQLNTNFRFPVPFVSL